MTYGVYTEDLKASYLSGIHSIEDCKRYCYSGRVICSEKQKRSTFEIRLYFHKWWEIKFSFRMHHLELGWLTITWGWDYYTCADKIVWRPENKEEK